MSQNANNVYFVAVTMLLTKVVTTKYDDEKFL